ncbi:MAG: hypothetical protein AAF488_03845 [Planctomycetota bacterium]
MSKDLIENIRKLNRQNHLARGLASPNTDTPSYHGLLVEIQDRVTAQIQERVQKLASEFEESWTPSAPTALAAASQPAAPPDRLDESIAELVLGVTALDRKIEALLADAPSSDSSRGLPSEDLAALVAKIDGLESRLESLSGGGDAESWTELRAAIGQLTEKVPTLEGDGTEGAANSSALTELHEKIDAIEELVRSSSSVEASGASLDEIESVLEQQFSRWVEQIAPSPEATVSAAAIESLDLSAIEQRLCEHLEQSLENGAVASAPSDLAARLDAFESTLEERLDAILSNLGPTVAPEDFQSALRESVREIAAEYDEENNDSGDASEAAAPTTDSKVADSGALIARLEGLEEGLRSTIESFHEKTTQTVLDRCLELEHSIPKGIEANLSEGVSVSEDGAAGSREVVDVVRSLVEGNALPTDLVELPDMVLHLRKDFSLLVHTINSHLEETRNLSNQVSRCVVEAMKDLDDSRPIPALDEALTKLEELRSLPAQVRDEVQEALARSTSSDATASPATAPAAAAATLAHDDAAIGSGLPDLPDLDSIEATVADADLDDLTADPPEEDRDPLDA